MKAVHTYLHYRLEEQKAKREKEKAYTPAKADTSLIPQTIRALGEEDADGSYWWYFQEPREIDGKKYTGLKWQRSTGEPYIDPDKAQALARRKTVIDQVTHTETVWDYDEFYVLRQKKLITEAELDAIMITPEARFSLVVLDD